MNPLSDLLPQDVTASTFPPHYYQALQIKDIIAKALRYNKTSVNIDLDGETIHEENMAVLGNNGFQVEKWHKGYFISWNNKTMSP